MTKVKIYNRKGRCFGVRQAYFPICVLLLISTCFPLVHGDARSDDRIITLINRSNTRVEVYWVHPDDRGLHLMSSPYLIPGSDMPLNSYVGHEFEAHELPSTKTGVCKSSDETCRRTIFAVSENDEQTVTINSDFEAEFSDSKIQAHQEAGELIKHCKELISTIRGVDIENQMDRLVDCVQTGVARSLEKMNEEINFQSSVRKDIASRLENYTCDDDSVDSSSALRTESWFHNNMYRQVNIMHDRPASKIHVVDNFITEDECEAMRSSAEATLHRATVADGKGGSQYSEHRKAMQAGIEVPWHLEKQGHPIARLSRRVYDYTNHVLGLAIEEHGQEDLMSIQYSGRGRDDTEPDRYTPHCDGDCTGLPHKYGTRMATMVMYCTIPSSGGHTNFRNAGVHVKPQKGSAIFFSYIDPVTRLMDTGFTEHSGCPVYEGEKKIVTQWIRYGVDSHNPWDSFNTLGLKISDVDGDDYSDYEE